MKKFRRLIFRDISFSQSPQKKAIFAGNTYIPIGVRTFWVAPRVCEEKLPPELKPVLLYEKKIMRRDVHDILINCVIWSVSFFMRLE